MEEGSSYEVLKRRSPLIIPERDGGGGQGEGVSLSLSHSGLSFHTHFNMFSSFSLPLLDIFTLMKHEKGVRVR